MYQYQAVGPPTVTAHDLGGNLATGIVSTPSGAGYWLVDLGANVYATGDAVTYPAQSPERPPARPRPGPLSRQPNSMALYSASLCSGWRASMSRTVPDLDRMTSDWLVAPNSS